VSPLRVMIDNNIVDALFHDPDTLAIVTRLQRGAAIRLLITHLQEDQLARAPHHIRKTLKLLNPAAAVTSRGVWAAATDEQLKQEGNQSSFRRWADTLIALTAVSRVDVFVTSDPDLMNRAKLEVEKGRLKLKVWNYEEFVRQVKIFDTLRS
jgi:predicted nucleic acid-binding protein